MRAAKSHEEQTIRDALGLPPEAPAKQVRGEIRRLSRIAAEALAYKGELQDALAAGVSLVRRLTAANERERLELVAQLDAWSQDVSEL